MADMPQMLTGVVSLAAAVILAALPFADVQELTGTQFCQRLTAEEVSTIVGAARTSKPDADRCTFFNAARPAIRFLNSNHETAAEFKDFVALLKGKVIDGPGGAIISAVAADLQNGKWSAAWFLVGKSPVEIEFDGGIELEKARAMIEAARK
jgi:hypothetical protein